MVRPNIWTWRECIRPGTEVRLRTRVGNLSGITYTFLRHMERSEVQGPRRLLDANWVALRNSKGNTAQALRSHIFPSNRAPGTEGLDWRGNA